MWSRFRQGAFQITGGGITVGKKKKNRKLNEQPEEISEPTEIGRRAAVKTMAGTGAGLVGLIASFRESLAAKRITNRNKNKNKNNNTVNGGDTSSDSTSTNNNTSTNTNTSDNTNNNTSNNTNNNTNTGGSTTNTNTNNNTNNNTAFAS